MDQSFGKKRQHLGEAMRSGLALKQDAVDAISTSIRRAAGKAPPKSIAYRVDMSDEGVRKIRDAERAKHRLESIVSFMFADPDVAKVIERYARLAQEPDFWTYEAQREFNRDLFREGRDG